MADEQEQSVSGNVNGYPEGRCSNFKAHPEPHEHPMTMPGSDLAMMVWCPGRDKDWI